MTLGLRSTLAAPEECGPYLLSNSPNECTLPAPGLRLLCVGNDAVLLESRTKVLQQAGYVVKPCTSSAANFWVRDGQFDATLVCRSVTFEQGATIASEAHARGQMKVFRLASPNGNTETPYDGHIDMSGGPARFLRDLGLMLGMEFPKTGAQAMTCGRADDYGSAVQCGQTGKESFC